MEIFMWKDPENLSAHFIERFFCFPAEVLDAEGGVFGVHALPGDALHLGFQHFVGILVGLVEHPDLQKCVPESLRGQQFPGKVQDIE